MMNLELFVKTTLILLCVDVYMYILSYFIWLILYPIGFQPFVDL
jgi:hypothetical protein